MRTWKLKIRSGRAVDLSERSPVEFRPTRWGGLKALGEVEELRYDQWNTEAVFGLLVQCYEARFYRKWRFTSEQGQRNYLGLRNLVREVGLDETARAIRLIFSPKFKWVTNPGLALVSRDFYGNHIVPALLEQKENQEPGQYTGPREGVPRYVSPEEFWGK